MPFIGFFLNNRIGQFIGIAILLSGAFFSWLAVHDHNLWNEATNKFNEMQQEIIAKKEQLFNQQTEVIKENADKLKEEAAQKEAEAKKQLDATYGEKKK